MPMQVQIHVSSGYSEKHPQPYKNEMFFEVPEKGNSKVTTEFRSGCKPIKKSTCVEILGGFAVVFSEDWRTLAPANENRERSSKR